MAETTKAERRVFLRVLGAAAATLAASACGSESTGTTTGDVGGGGAGSGGAKGTGGAVPDAGMCTAIGTPVGDPGIYTTNGLHLVSGTGVLVGRDAGGVYALSSICPHRGCNLNGDGLVFSTGIECRCHGSVFGLDGSVQKGPAFSGLPAFSVSVACGQLYVDTSQVVASSQRLSV